MKILIVEDYKKINDLLAMFTKQEGYEVQQAFSAEEALSYCKTISFDVIILDLMLPKMQGEALIKELRAQSDVYIMVISAKVQVASRIDAISLGADDYLTKPFAVEEVMVRLKNVSKRLKIDKPLVLSFNQKQLMIHPLSREVIVGGKVVNLTKYEFDILNLLATHSNIVYSREHIISICFEDSDAYDRVIDAFIKNIRKKIDVHSNKGSYIKTHYGIGYQFVGEADV